MSKPVTPYRVGKLRLQGLGTYGNYTSGLWFQIPYKFRKDSVLMQGSKGLVRV